MFQCSVPTLSRIFCDHVGVSDHSCNVIRSALPGYRSVQAPWPTSDASPSASASKSSLPLSLPLFFSFSLSRFFRYIPERSQNKKKATGQRESPGTSDCLFTVPDATQLVKRHEFYARVRSIEILYLVHIKILNATNGITHRNKHSTIMWLRWQSSANKLREYQITLFYCHLNYFFSIRNFSQFIHK